MASDNTTLLKNIVRALDILVLLGSILIITIISFEMLNGIAHYKIRSFMQIQFWICIVFLLDILVRFIAAENKPRFILRNLIFLIVSIPWLNLTEAADIHLSGTAYYLIKGMPLLRGAYSTGIIIGWVAKTRIATLFTAYIVTILLFTYFSAVVMFLTEHDTNPEIKNFWTAVCWACMNVTTVGSPVIAMKVPGQILAILLPAGGMMLFAIFTAYITNIIQKEHNGNSGQQSSPG